MLSSKQKQLGVQIGYVIVGIQEKLKPPQKKKGQFATTEDAFEGKCSYLDVTSAF
jgi:hypothetical protein